MGKDTSEYFTFKKNVGYNVGVRRSISDSDGILLTNEIPTVRIEEKDLRDFKIANKRQFTEGLIVEVPEESLDWDTPNSITDEQVDELLRSYAKLKSVLPTITSVPIVEKILAIANVQERPKKTISLVQARLDEIKPDELEIIRPDDMRGTSD